MCTFSSSLSTKRNSQVNQTIEGKKSKLIRIFSYICENHNLVINMKDNLNRTPWHYACIMNDEAIIRILQKGNAKKVDEIFECLLRA